MSAPELLRKPSAVLPVAMSSAALAVVLAHLWLHGPAPQTDEGTAAHLWQLLMAGQVPVIGYFSVRWLPSSPRVGLLVLGVQFVGALAAAVPVFLLHW